MRPKSNLEKPVILFTARIKRSVLNCLLLLNILFCAVLVNAQTYTTIANGDWNSAATWQGGVVPSTNNAAGGTIHIAHTINYNVLTALENWGELRIQPLSGTVAKLTIPSGINITNNVTGKFYVINGQFQQARFVGGGNTGTPQAGSFKNIGGYIEILSSFIEVPQDWTSESGVRIMRNSCLYAGQNYSLSGISSIDTLDAVNLSLGWHGAGNVQISDARVYFSDARFQLAGSGGNFSLSSCVASGDIDYITLKNHTTNTIGSGDILAASSVNVLTGLNVDAYCVSNATKYLPNGKFSGTQSFDCSLLYFPNSQCVNVDLSGIDIGITKTVNSSTCVLVNNTRVFTVTATNNNRDYMATGVTVNDLLPAGLTFVSATGNGSYNSATGVWTIGTILPLQARSIMITTTVSSAPPTTITNTATLGAMDQVDANASNNSASVNLTVCPITLTGTVFDDANGLENSLISGVGDGTPDNVQTYISLVSVATNRVERVRSVSPDGTYSFSNVPTNANYRLVLTTTFATGGQAQPATTLPSNWVYTGEHIGNVAGNDGLADGIISVTVGVSNVLNINFGINKLPDSDNKIYFIPVPTSDTIYRLNGSSQMPGPLSGSDLEDGVLGSSKNVEITSLPTNGSELYYRNIQITVGADGINPPSNTNPFRINNYIIDSLSIKIFPGSGAITTAFNYVFLDAAAMRKPAFATYTINYSLLLPVHFINFEATLNKSNVKLVWTTAAHQVASEYRVERSHDGTTYFTIGTGIAGGKSQYSFEDTSLNGTAKAIFYYRVRSLDRNRKAEVSEVRSVRIARKTENNVSIHTYPNPVMSELVVVTPATWQKNTVIYELYNGAGHLVLRDTAQGSNTMKVLDLHSLPEGMYVIKIASGADTVRQKIIKH